MASSPGFLAVVKVSGTSTAMTDEATTNTAGNTWQITDASRRVLDRTVVPTFEDNAVAIPAGDILSIDYLFGKVTFTASKTGPITFATGNYMPMTDVAGANSYGLNMTADILDATDFAGATANNGFRQKNYGLRSVSVTLSAWEDLAAGQVIRTAWLNRNEVVIEVQPSGGNSPISRGWYDVESANQSGDTAALETKDVTLQLAANVEAAFSWSDV